MASVAKAMASPESGLEVRDRMWLKITIPNAFLGTCGHRGARKEIMKRGEGGFGKEKQRTVEKRARNIKRQRTN